MKIFSILLALFALVMASTVIATDNQRPMLTFYEDDQVVLERPMTRDEHGYWKALQDTFDDLEAIEKDAERMAEEVAGDSARLASAGMQLAAEALRNVAGSREEGKMERLSAEIEKAAAGIEVRVSAITEFANKIEQSARRFDEEVKRNTDINYDYLEVDKVRVLSRNGSYTVDL